MNRRDCACACAQILGKVGRVIQVQPGDRIVVTFYGDPFVLNAAALTRSEPPPNAFVTGDVVRLLDDMETVEMLQVGHGDWNYAMKEVS